MPTTQHCARLGDAHVVSRIYDAKAETADAKATLDDDKLATHLHTASQLDSHKVVREPLNRTLHPYWI